MKLRYFIYLSYKGTAYHGWQIQPNGISVQELLAKALSTILRNNIEIVGAGRTDAGVHAKLMVAHFDSDTKITDSKHLVAKLNSYLPNDIGISKIIEVKADAHARFDAISREYEYHVQTTKNVFDNELSACITFPLDFEKMNQAAEKLKSHRDFTSFSKLHTDAKTNICKINKAEWRQDGEKWIFTIQADRFLRNMVRAIVGTLFEVGRGRMTIDEFEYVIQAKNRCKAGVSVPAQGLFLVDIQYPETIFTTHP